MVTSAKSISLDLDGVMARVLSKINLRYSPDFYEDTGNKPDTRICALQMLLYMLGEWACPVLEDN